MNFTIIEHTYRVAAEQKNCEASKMFWEELPKPLDYRGIDFSDILLFYKSKSGKIKKGEKYLLFVFVDEWGERLEFAAIPEMHKFMFFMGFYLPAIQDAFIEYRRKLKIQQYVK